MPSNLRAYEALDYAKKFIGNMDLDRMAPRLLDDVSKMFWMYAPWRWTLGLLSPVTTLSSTQDYAVTLPADFLFLQDVVIVDGKTPRHVKPTAIYPATGTLVAGQISSVAVQTVAAQTVLRVNPTPGILSATAPAQKIIGVYKQNSPTINLDSMNTAGALLLPDEFFWVYQEGVLWKAMMYAQDPRAGSVTVKQGQVEYTGQRASFEAALQTCVAQEKIYLVDKQEEAR